MMQGHRPKNIEKLLPAAYQIKLQGQLDESWSTWLDGMSVRTEQDADGQTITILTGTLLDQPALYGLLSRIRDLDLLLLSVQRLPNPLD